MSGTKTDESSLIILLSTVFFPPLGVYLLKGCGPEVIIAVCLTILVWFPGIIYAVYLWMQAGGFHDTSAAEARVERAKAKYRERRAKKKTGVARESPDERTPIVIEESQVVNQYTNTTTTVAAVPESDARDAAGVAEEVKRSQAATGALWQTHRDAEKRKSTQSTDLSSSRPHGLQAYPRPQSASSVRAQQVPRDVPVTESESKPNTSGSQSEKKQAAETKSGKNGKASSAKNPGVGGFYSGLWSSNKGKAREGSPPEMKQTKTMAKEEEEDGEADGRPVTSGAGAVAGEATSL